MKALNVGMIGYGFMGRAHSNAFAQVAHYFPVKAGVRRKVVCGRNREGVEELAHTWGWEETATNWREVVARDDIDLIDIAAPNYLHAEIAIAAAEAGKIVLCEKPLANSLEDARRMAVAVETAGVANGVWFNYRRVPAVAFARELIERGALGRIFHYRAQYLQEWGTDTSRPINWKMSRATAGSGVNGDLNSHIIDMALMLAGPIREVSATSETFIRERDIPGSSASRTRASVACRSAGAM
jgi:myo-inositol 2-dehydrogenase/D-chiro-inositol 1-dehydrogenase